MKVVVLTTSYPRHAADFAGRFVADGVEHLRSRGLEVEVVAPGAFRDFGLTRSGGVPHNLRKRPWAGPLLLGSMARAVRRASRHADLVHAHWLQAGLAARLSGRPFVVTLHGTDVQLAKRAPWLARPVLRSARAVICVSESLAEDARALGAPDPVVIANGVELPAELGREAVPPEVLYAGRLAPEKGVEDLLAAADGLPLVVAGDGPLRPRVHGALGFVSREELSALYSKASVVVCPSRREGFGLACAEAMAHGRPVVATRVGGLAELVVDEETGLLVPPRDPRALRAALERLLADGELRRRFGLAGRERIAELCGWERVTDRTIAIYEAALGRDAGRASS